MVIPLLVRTAPEINTAAAVGGGAFLEFLEGKTLPAIAALEARAGG